MILVTGATGRTGRRVARRLSKWGYTFTAMVRDPERAAGLKSKSIDLAEGDFGKPDSLKSALEGVEHAFMLSPDCGNQFEMEKNFIDAAREAGVKYLVKYSVIGASPDSPSRLLRWHGEAEEYLRGSGLRHTIVRPSVFMQNFSTHFAQSIKENREVRLPFGEAGCAWVDVRDTARLIAKLLTENGNSDGALTVTGPEALTGNDVAAIFSDKLGKKVEYTDVKPKEFRKDLVSYGMPEHVADAVAELYKLIGDGLCNFVTDTFYEVTEKQSRTFEEFVDDNLSEFLKKKKKKA